MRFLHGTRFLVYDFEISEKLKFAIEVIISPDHWETNVVSREPTAFEAVEAFLNLPSSLTIEERISLNRVRVGKKYEYGTDKSVIANYVQSLIDHVVELR